MFFRHCRLPLAAVVLLFAAVGFAQPLPVEAYSQLPIITDLQLSPNGKKVAYLGNVGDETVLVAKDLATGAETPLTKTDNRVFKFRWITWANDDRILFSAYYPDRRYGFRSTETRLLSISATDPEDVELLVKPRQDTAYGARDDHYSQFQDNVIGAPPGDPDHVFISIDLDEATYASVYKINVNNGQRKRVKGAMKPVRDWMVDQQGRVRVGGAFEANSTRQSVFVHHLASDRWIEAWEHQTFEAPPVSPLGFGLDPNQLYVRAYHEGRASIFTVDTADAALPKKLIAHDDNYDIDGELIYSPKSNDVVGIHHSGARGGRIYWSDDYRNFQAAVDKALPATINQLVSFSDDERRYLVLASNATVPGVYYLGDRDKRSLTPIINTYPQLEGKLSGKRKVVYKARDGKAIEAFLTLPPGYKPADGPLSTLILPHGGPMARDYGDFDYWTEFFASRGLAVLQPNFRGSSGYGWEFEMEALQNYGGTMQDDLTDAAHWLVEQRIARADRIGIAGASYGGYAALMGAVKTPELFRCAISFAGIGNLASQRNHYRYTTAKRIASKQFGLDNAALRAASPYYQVEKIRIPILLAHGDQDRTVPVEQSREMAEALRKHGKNVTYLELEDGSHHLELQRHRHELFKAMDTFLRQHLLTEPTVAAVEP